jgi:collagen triple helix repeat protein
MNTGLKVGVAAVATATLFGAGGVSTAVAAELITGDDIAKNTISSANLAKNSVGRSELQSALVEDGKDGKNGKDGKDGAPGPSGPQGPAGLSGSQGAAGENGASDYSIRAQAAWALGTNLAGTANTVAAIAPGETRVLTAECSGGRKVVSGGYQMEGLASTKALPRTVAGDLQVLTDAPYMTDAEDENAAGVWSATRWYVVVKNKSTTESVKVTPYVVCAKVSLIVP